MSAAIAEYSTELPPTPSGSAETIAFHTFASSRLAGPNGADAFVSPALASTWAKAIGTFWTAAVAAGQMSAALPWRVVDLAPGDGSFARLMLRALRTILAKSDLPVARLRYEPCLARGIDPRQWLAGAGLLGDAQVFIRVENVSGQPDFASDANPMVVLALGYLRRFPGLLRAAHHGQWLEGRIAAVEGQATDECVDYSWAPLPDAEPLRQRYLHSLASACVQLPHIGLRMLEHLERASAGRFLWLAIDHGVTTEQAMRMGALAPPAQWPASGIRPAVNFHGLGHDQVGRGAWVRHWQCAEDGPVVQAIWRHDGSDLPDASLGDLADRLARFQPDDAATCRYLATALGVDAPPALRLSLLRLSDYDFAVMAPVLGAWANQPPALDDIEYAGWGDALVRVWENHAGSAAACRDLGVLAVHWGRFDLARAIFTATGNSHCLALCEALSGNSTRALELLDDIAAGDDQAMALRAEIVARVERWQGLGWYAADRASDGEITLEPLGTEHAEVMFAQYRDPQIGVLTRLPEWESVGEVRDWIVEANLERGRMGYAVMHRDRGFVGVVSLHAGTDDAYFYFWIGCDHQGRGYGRRAGHLLCAQAEMLGLQRIFTSVYPQNLRSIQALAELRFRPVDVEAYPPDDDLIFLCRGSADGGSHVVALATLLKQIDSPIVLREG